MDWWLVLKLVAALLGYLIALVVALLDYRKPFKDGRTRLHRWARTMLGAFLLVACLATLGLIARDHLQSKNASQQLARMEATLGRIAESTGAQSIEGVEQAINDLKGRVREQEASASEMRKKLGSTEQVLGDMKREAAPRALTPRQADSMKKQLSAELGTVHLTLPVSDREAEEYGGQLGRVFEASGWKVERTHVIRSPPLQGLRIRLRTDTPTKSHPAWTVRNALLSAGITFTVGLEGSIDPIQVWLDVGAKR